uniref:Core shell protein Gag P30 domain-containing protein n=1 Tax=Peromyscus maniculatus bairdii TaxID=230844 RepID=A0A8C8U877_PERMB
MGQAVATPLSLTTDHWSDVKARGNNEGVIIRENKWITLCEAEWVMMNVGWPREGSFNLSLISQVEGKVFAPSPYGHPDQVPYIAIWRSLVENPFPWVKPFLPQPPPVSGPSAPPNPDSSLYPVLPHKETPKPPVLPPDPHTPLIDLLTEDPPPYQAGPPGEPAEDAAPSPIAGRLRGRRDDPPDESRAFPLREGPNRQLQYWPFSASDLYNWKQHNPPFSRDPIALTGLIESILVTHRPTWDDCQQLLQTLLTVEEKQRVFLEARKQVPGDDGRPTQLPNIIDAAFPLSRPDWDFNTPEGREHLCLYRQLLLAGLRAAARRPTNLAQVRNVIQGKEEIPGAFLERLKEAYRMYTPYDPEDLGQAPGVILSFIYQSSSDIRTKLQRLEGLQALGLPDLLKEAEKVFNKRETPEEREERRWQKQEERDKKQHREMKKVLAAVVSQGQWREGDRSGERRSWLWQSHYLEGSRNFPRGSQIPRSFWCYLACYISAVFCYENDVCLHSFSQLTFP